MSSIRKISQASSRLASWSAGAVAAAALASSTLTATPAQALDSCLGYAAIACTPWNVSVQDDSWFQVAGRVKHKRLTTGTLQVFCPVFDTSDSLNTATWNNMTMAFLDPDGAGDQARVRAALRFVSDSGGVGTVVTVDSNDAFGTGPGFDETSEGFSHRFDFARNYYYIQASVSRSDPALAPEFGGFKLCDVVQ